MGEILVGTAGWADKSLLDSGWYPPPAESTARLWVQRTPEQFTFNVKAFSLLTGHPTQPGKLYKDLRPQTEKTNIYPGDLPPQSYEEVWSRFLSAIEPLHEAGKLGVLLFQFPPWFTIRRSNKQYLLEVAARCRPMRVAIELRHESWLRDDNRSETLDFLRDHQLPFVCVDMPQGYRSSIPPVLAATSDLAVVRFHGHSEKWTARSVQERFDYRYSREELAGWAPRLAALAGAATSTHVLMNNCRGDAAQRNARQLIELLHPSPQLR